LTKFRKFYAFNDLLKIVLSCTTPSKYCKEHSRVQKEGTLVGKHCHWQFQVNVFNSAKL